MGVRLTPNWAANVLSIKRSRGLKIRCMMESVSSSNMSRVRLGFLYTIGYGPFGNTGPIGYQAKTADEKGTVGGTITPGKSGV